MIILTDENFEEMISKADKPVLVDFWASWCSPCLVLGSILEKIAEEYKDKFVLAKVNLDEARIITQKFGIDRIPTVVLFKNGKPISGFIGVRPEPAIKEWLEKMLGEGNSNEESKEDKEKSREKVEEKGGENEEIEKIEEIIKEYKEYAEMNGLKLNSDEGTVKRLIKGLLENEKKYGNRYCPCRRVTGNPEEDREKICPCKFIREEIEKQGHCFCGLFFKK